MSTNRDATPDGSEIGENNVKFQIEEGENRNDDFKKKASQKASMRISKLDAGVQDIARSFSMANEDTGDIHIEDLSKAFKSLIEEQEQRHDAERDRVEAEKEKKKWQKVAVIVIVILVVSYAVIFFTVFGVTSAVVGGNNGIISDIVEDAQIFEIDENGSIKRKGKKTKVKTVKTREVKNKGDIFDGDFNFDELKSVTVLLGEGMTLPSSLRVAGHTQLDESRLILFTQSVNVPGVLIVKENPVPQPLSKEGLDKFFTQNKIATSDEFIPAKDPTSDRRKLQETTVTATTTCDSSKETTGCVVVPSTVTSKNWDATSKKWVDTTKNVPDDMAVVAEITKRTDDWNVIMEYDVTTNGVTTKKHIGVVFLPDSVCKDANVPLFPPPPAYGFTEVDFTQGNCWYILHTGTAYGASTCDRCWGNACDAAKLEYYYFTARRALSAENRFLSNDNKKPLHNICSACMGIEE